MVAIFQNEYRVELCSIHLTLAKISFLSLSNHTFESSMNIYRLFAFSSAVNRHPTQ